MVLTRVATKPGRPVVQRGHPLARGLIAAWPFMEGGGTTVRNIAENSIGSGRHGDVTSFGGSTFTWQEGEVGWGVNNASGGSSKMGIVANGLFENADWPIAHSFFALIHPAVFPGSDQNECYLLAFGGAGAVWLIRQNQNTFRYYLDGTTTLLVDVAAGSWDRLLTVCATRDADLGYAMYVDGVKLASGTWVGNGSIGATDRSIGGHNNLNRDMVGTHYDMRFWNRGLAEQEVCDLHGDIWGLYRSKTFVSLMMLAADTVTVDAGTDQSLTMPGEATLDATVTGSPDSTLWTKSGGPGQVEFADAESVDTTVAFSVPGTYRLRLTATLGSTVVSDELVVTVTGPPEAPLAATIKPVEYPVVLETIMAILDGWTPITAADLNVYQDTLRKLEKTLGAGPSNAAASQFGPKGGNTDLAQRLGRFLEQDGGLNDVAYVSGTATLGEFSENGGGKVIPFGKNIEGATSGPQSYYVLFTCKAPGVTGAFYELDAPALWWTDGKFEGSVIIKARTTEGDAIAIGDDTAVVYGLLAIGYGAFATGTL